MNNLRKTAERLYFVRPRYIQYNGSGPKPNELALYESMHEGKMPPHIPLPEEPVSFFPSTQHPAFWPGEGPLPSDVLAYVDENGTLPRYAPSDCVNTNRSHSSASMDLDEDDYDWDDDLTDEEWL